MSRHLNHQQIIDALTEDPGPLIAWAADELIALGAKTEWSLEDNFACTESLVAVGAREYGLPSAGDQDDEALRFYGEAAIALGYETDYEPDDDDPDSEED